MRLAEGVNNQNIVAGVSPIARKGMPDITARHRSGEPSQSAGVRDLSPQLKVSLAGQYTKTIRSNTGLAISGQELLPPDSFIRTFQDYYPETIALFVAQYRTDRARSNWQAAAMLASTPNLQGEVKGAMIAKRDEMRVVYEALAEDYDRRWPHRDTTLFIAETEENGKVATNARNIPGRDKHFAWRLGRVIKDRESDFSKLLRDRYPEVAAAYAAHLEKEAAIRDDVSRAKELARGSIFYCDERLIPDLPGTDHLVISASRIIAEGLHQLNLLNDALYIHEARSLLEIRVDELTAVEDEGPWLPNYKLLREEWPHITVLEEQGNIISAKGAQSYYAETLALRGKRWFKTW